MAAPEHSENLIIGKDISWGTIKEKVCRVKHFTHFARIEGGKIRDATNFLPYATLIIESPNLPQEASMPVVHKDDFRTLWDIFEQRGVSPEEEVLVFYSPFFRNRLLKFLSVFMPRLHIFIYPKGFLEETLDPNFRPTDPITWSIPIAEWRPKYWK